MQFTIPEISTRRERIYFVFLSHGPPKEHFGTMRDPKNCVAITNAYLIGCSLRAIKFNHIFSSVNDDPYENFVLTKKNL